MFSVTVRNLEKAREFGKFGDNEAYPVLEINQEPGFGLRLIIPDDDGVICNVPASFLRYLGGLVTTSLVTNQYTEKPQQHRTQAQSETKSQESSSRQQQKSPKKDS